MEELNRNYRIRFNEIIMPNCRGNVTQQNNRREKAHNKTFNNVLAFTHNHMIYVIIVNNRLKRQHVVVHLLRFTASSQLKQERFESFAPIVFYTVNMLLCLCLQCNNSPPNHTITTTTTAREMTVVNIAREPFWVIGALMITTI